MTNKKATVSQADIDNTLAGLDTVSAKIRYLDSLGWKRGQIAKHLGKRYQHVRNVLITPLMNKEG